MGTRATIVLMAGLVFALAASLPRPVQAQDDSPRRAVLDSSSKPIGKVVTADGSVIIEHAGAAIVQANVGANPSRRRSVISSIWAIWFEPVPTVGSASTSSMELRSTCRATPA
ncbi:hypothetical protein ACQ5SK_02250 [Bradyrhizobium japonicum]